MKWQESCTAYIAGRWRRFDFADGAPATLSANGWGALLLWACARDRTTIYDLAGRSFSRREKVARSDG